MIPVLVRGVVIWVIMVIAAILNGLLRDALLNPSLGEQISLPLSGITLSMLVFLITYISLPFIGVVRAKACLCIGLLWVTLTLVFEYLFGHYVAGIPWSDIKQVFYLTEGNLFVMVMLVTLLAPWLSAKLRRLS